jgi:hypothetical protein
MTDCMYDDVSKPRISFYTMAGNTPHSVMPSRRKTRCRQKHVVTSAERAFDSTAAYTTFIRVLHDNGRSVSPESLMALIMHAMDVMRLEFTLTTEDKKGNIMHMIRRVIGECNLEHNQARLVMGIFDRVGPSIIDGLYAHERLPQYHQLQRGTKMRTGRMW